MTHFIYKYKHLKKRISYEDGKKYFEQNKQLNFHLGQLKLFMAEIFFLARYINLDNVILLYVGAANGYHTHLLAKLFPQFMFHLYDKAQFHDIYTNEPLSNVKLFHKYFTHKDSYTYKKKNMNLLFMCDMRDLDIKIAINNIADNNSEIDKIVAKDMEDQLEWAEIMQPYASYLKFRLPYYSKKYKYYRGTIYIQPYASRSTELRLFITNHDLNNKKYYNCNKFDERMAYFNFFTRNEKQNTKWNNILEKYKIRNIWDNCYAMYICEFFLKNNNKPHSDEDVVKFFISVIDFHKIENKKKYSIIYES